MLIQCKNISKEYMIEGRKVQALVDVSVDIPENSLMAICGKSGAGKSTLLHIIGTLDRPSSGDLYIAGDKVSSFSDRQASVFRNQKIGFIFQSNNLLPEFSALENVMMPGLIAGAKQSAVRSRAGALLEAVGLAERMNHRPSELSGGEQQRVAIARSLVMAPPLLLADEPTGNLDQKTSDTIQDLLLGLCRDNKVTMLLVTHDLDLANKLPQRLEMADGRIL
jgi:lipoprotein-releasing system ATP-binding protein